MRSRLQFWLWIGLELWRARDRGRLAGVALVEVAERGMMGQVLNHSLNASQRNVLDGALRRMIRVGCRGIQKRR